MQRKPWAVVAYVVPVVVVRRIVDRIQPDHVDAQILDVVQAGNDSLQIADAVAVAVHETARIDLKYSKAFLVYSILSGL